ncbi:porin [Sorangium sp. So ce1036]|uniref:porin n=1 Tax=Sorangium sp. So ce1036 TaxID=3133328 RepID=UPI003F11D952
MSVTLSGLSALAQPGPQGPAQPPAAQQPPAQPLPAEPPAVQPPAAAVPAPGGAVAPPPAAQSPAPPDQAAPLAEQAPPPPPPPGTAAAIPPPPPPPPQVFAPTAETAGVAERQPLAGWHGSFFLRDASDTFRLYPKGRMHLDFYSSFGGGVSEVRAQDGGNALQPRFFVRRARLELDGELLKRWSFKLDVDFGGQGLGNANGKSQTSAAPAGSAPTAESARFAAVQGTSSSASLADVWLNYSVVPALNFMFGQFTSPFSMENQTSSNSITFMERNIAVRSFAHPEGKSIGLMAWGDLAGKALSYGVGVFGGDGQNRTGVDAPPDFIGRVVVRPFSGDKEALLSKAQIGLSARHGERDQEYVGYDYAPIKTGQGYTLWGGGYKDSLSRQIHVIPSGAQNAIGGELRLPIKRVELRAEAYYLANNTREAVEGYQLGHTERLGQVRGLGYYVQLSAWPLGDAFVTGDPGTSPRPAKVDLSKDLGKPKSGLEVAALLSGISATYDGASREGAYDEKTPGAEAGPGTDLSVMQVGLAANYWHTKHVRLSVNYNVYLTPGSGSADNLLRVPGNTLKEADPDAHALHELGTRLGLSF